MLILPVSLGMLGLMVNVQSRQVNLGLMVNVQSRQVKLGLMVNVPSVVR